MEQGDEAQGPMPGEDGDIMKNKTHEKQGESYEVNQENDELGVKDKDPFYGDPMQMWEIMEQTFLYLGSHDLERASKVCSLWRSEGQRRKEALVCMSISSRNSLMTAIHKLRIESPKAEVNSLDLTQCPPRVLASKEFSEFISLLTLALGTLVISPPDPIGIPVIHKILKRCSNISEINVGDRYLHLDNEDDENESDLENDENDLEDDENELQDDENDLQDDENDLQDDENDLDLENDENDLQDDENDLVENDNGDPEEEIQRKIQRKRSRRMRSRERPRGRSTYRPQLLCNQASAQLFPIPILNEKGQQTGQHLLSSVRNVDYGPTIYPHCTISSILQSCPNVTSLSISDPFKNLEILEQLKGHQMNLVRFSYVFGEFKTTKYPHEVTEFFQEFLKVQAPTLKYLTLRNDEVERGPEPTVLSPFPIYLPTLTHLGINKMFITTIAQVLESAPALQKLGVTLGNQWQDHQLYPVKRDVMPEEMPLPTHDNLVDFEVTCVGPRELSMFGGSFRNLKRLTLSNFTKGVLQVVYKELSQIEKLWICEGWMNEPLENYDFTGVKASAGDEQGQGGIEEPYIGNMTSMSPNNEHENLKDFTLSLVPRPNMVTDEILTHGIFDILANLDEFVIGVENSWFSEESLEKLEFLMDRVPWNPSWTFDDDDDEDKDVEDPKDKEKSRHRFVKKMIQEDSS